MFALSSPSLLPHPTNLLTPHAHIRNTKPCTSIAPPTTGRHSRCGPARSHR